MSKTESEADDLTGVWNGTYRQTLVGDVAFTATLIQSGDHIGGSTHEPCIRSGCPRKTHLAILSGQRGGNSVSFVKSYDPPGFGFDTVNYKGELNADATEIAGMWSIGSVFFGAFVMTRAGRHAEVKADAKLTTVE
jgi:hypothetical protein